MAPMGHPWGAHMGPPSDRCETKLGFSGQGGRQKGPQEQISAYSLAAPPPAGRAHGYKSRPTRWQPPLLRLVWAPVGSQGQAWEGGPFSVMGKPRFVPMGSSRTRFPPRGLRGAAWGRRGGDRNSKPPRGVGPFLWPRVALGRIDLPPQSETSPQRAPKALQDPLRKILG